MFSNLGPILSSQCRLALSVLPAAVRTQSFRHTAIHHIVHVVILVLVIIIIIVVVAHAGVTAVPDSLALDYPFPKASRAARPSRLRDNAIGCDLRGDLNKRCA